MTVDDGLKAAFASVLGVLIGAVGWLVSRVMGNREASLLHTQEIAQVKVDVALLKKEALTQETVRQVVEAALDRRDRQNNEKRMEWDRRTQLEIKATVREEVEKMLPRFVKEIRNATGKHRRPTEDGEE